MKTALSFLSFFSFLSRALIALVASNPFITGIEISMKIMSNPSMFLSTASTASNGRQAVEAVERNIEGFDMIFMDISMPVMNGFEATRAIRARERNEKKDKKDKAVFIVALTGLNSERDQTEAFASGVDLFLTKPVSFKDVGDLLDKWNR